VLKNLHNISGYIIFDIENETKKTKRMKKATEYRINDKGNGVTFVNFNDGTYARVWEGYRWAGKAKEYFGKVSGNYDTKKWDVYVDSIWGLTIDPKFEMKSNPVQKKSRHSTNLVGKEVDIMPFGRGIIEKDNGKTVTVNFSGESQGMKKSLVKKFIL